jgi:hypothetical protein
MYEKVVISTSYSPHSTTSFSYPRRNINVY